MKSILLFLCFCLPIITTAQTIKGKVTDPANMPIEFVSVILKIDSNNSLSKTTDRNGNFEFTIIKKSKAYKLTFSLVGYKNADTTVSPGSQTYIRQTLVPELKTLKEVTIKGRKNILERKVDRLVFNVENNINTAGADGMDILGKTPLVKVDGDAIKMIGKEGLAVMINGRLTHLSGQALSNMLRSINADNISKIEVITNPPAQYDAAGNSGILNIITKRNTNPGYFATLSQRLNFNTYTTSAPSINLNYNLNKLMLFGGFGFSRGANGPTSNQTRNYELQTWQRQDKVKEESHYATANFGFELPLSRSTTIGASFNTSISHPNNTGNTRTQVYNNSTNTLDSMLNVDFNNLKKFKSQTLNIHLLNKLDTLGKTFDFDADYFNSASDIHNNSLNYNTLANGSPAISPVNRLQSNNDLASRGYTFNAEFNLPYKKSTFTFGAKSSFITSRSDVLFAQDFTIVSTTGPENIFRYNENIQALFASFKTSFGKWQFEGGLRAEATQTKGNSVTLQQIDKNSYVGLFPTLYLTYEISKEEVLSLNVGRRIGRPYFSSFNPYRIYQNQYDYSTGNPTLKPSYTNNFELTNTFHSFWTTTLSYGVTHDLEISVQQISNNSNIQITTLGNFLTSHDLLFDNSISDQVLPWWHTTNEISFYYSSNNSTSPLTQAYTSGYGADARTSNTINLNKSKTLSAGIDYSYSFPNNTGIYRFHSYSNTDFSMSSQWFNKALQVTLSVRDIFKTKNISYFTTYNNIGYRNGANNDSRRFIINLRYSFGNKKLNKGQSHSSSGSEQGRSGH